MSKRYFHLIVLSVFITIFAAALQHREVFAGGPAEGPKGSYKNMSIALIFPDNTSRAVTNARDYNQKTGTDVMDVDGIFTDLAAAFQRNFKSVVRVGKMEEVKALNVDLVAVIDLQYTLPDTVDKDMKYEVSATIMTPAQMKVDTIRGSSIKSPTSFPGTDGAKRIGDAIKVAVIEAEYRMEDALHESVKIAAVAEPNQLVKETATVSQSPAAADKSGLIASSSVEKAIMAPPTKHTTTDQSDEGAGPFSKKIQMARSSSPSSQEPVLSPAPAQKKKSASKAGTVASSKKTIVNLAPSREQKKAGKSDVHKVTSIDTTSGKNAYAIVIGVEHYRQKLRKADFATHDAQAVTEALTKVMGYPVENVITLINDKATNADLAKYLEKWLQKNVKTGSTVFIYFSGLGTSNPENGDVLLVPYDGDPFFIEQTGYSLKRMSDALRKLPAKDIMVVLDSCFSGAGGKSILVDGARPLAINLQNSIVLSRGMTVLAAASGSQVCSSYQAKGHSLFTYYMLDGIKNEDVILPDGSLDLGDLFSYVQPQVERIALKRNKSAQSPQLIELKNN